MDKQKLYNITEGKAPLLTSLSDRIWEYAELSILEFQSTAVTWPSGSPGHSWQNVSCGKTSIAHKGLLYAAKALAGACADLMVTPEILKEAKAEFSITAAEGYDCPIGPEVIPNKLNCS